MNRRHSILILSLIFIALSYVAFFSVSRGHFLDNIKSLVEKGVSWFRSDEDTSVTPSAVGCSSEGDDKNPKQNVIILIHGFTGDKHTWGQFIPLLREDKNLNASYEIHELIFPTKWHGVNMPTVEMVAENLKAQLYVRYKSCKNVYLIAHSMGGFVYSR